MKTKFYTALLLVLSMNVYSQKATDDQQIDSVLQQKFVLSSKNDVATSGRFKHLQVFINYGETDRTYTISVFSDREINGYLEIKDQDENTIYFKPIVIHAGSNFIPLETEDGTQTYFKLNFLDNRNDNAAVYVFRFVKEITYSRR